jgi:hypothetical protein
VVDYVKLTATALRLITAAGKPVVLNKYSKAPADPDKPWRGPATPTVAETQTEQAVELGTSKVQETSYGKLIQKGEMPDTVSDVWLVARTPSNPDLEDYDTLECEGVTHRIEHLIRLRPATVTLLYVLGTSR